MTVYSFRSPKIEFIQLSEIIRLETEREAPKVWFPKVHLSKWVHHTAWEPSEMVERDDDEDPGLYFSGYLHANLDISIWFLRYHSWRGPDLTDRSRASSPSGS